MAKKKKQKKKNTPSKQPVVAVPAPSAGTGLTGYG